MIVTTANRFMMIFMTVPYITVISGIMMIFAPLCASKLTSQTRLTSQRRKRQPRTCFVIPKFIIDKQLSCNDFN
jgi:hypothetical protein